MFVFEGIGTTWLSMIYYFTLKLAMMSYVSKGTTLPSMIYYCQLELRLFLTFRQAGSKKSVDKWL